MKETLLKKLNFGEGIQFDRILESPIMTVKDNTFYQDSVTTADILDFKDETFLYFCGVSGGQERIGMATISKDEGKGFFPKKINMTPIIDVGDEGRFDSKHVTDPASVNVNEKVFLYYSGIGDCDDSIGVATSDDGYNFSKFVENPVLKGRAPEIVFFQGTFYLFYVLSGATGGYNIHLALSDDGFRFTNYGEEPVLSPGRGGWDSKTVTTPRIFRNKDNFYMIYAGDDKTKDFPHGFGLAVSQDLMHWEKYPKKPVFVKGKEGNWDDYAIWFGTVFLVGEKIFLLYEGCTKIGSDEFESQIGIAVM